MLLRIDNALKPKKVTYFFISDYGLLLRIRWAQLIFLEMEGKISYVRMSVRATFET